MVPRILFPLLLILPNLSFAWICYPPAHLLPTRDDCEALINGLYYLSRTPPDAGVKNWGRHLPSTEFTEQLPRLYYVVNKPPSTCGILVDTHESDASVVATFRLVDVADAVQVVYTQCLNQRHQVGLEFPTEEARVFAKVIRLDGLPSRLLKLGPWRADGHGNAVGEDGGVRREVLPNGMGVLYIADAEPGWRRNISRIS
ncbi:MAG: hypothetical protein Q9211_001290 [Gyalolechia sp. 1 TL-2023]